MLPNWLYGKSKSKLASILGGGGGAPADYDQVKAQVTQNTENILSLSDALDDKAALTQIANRNLLDNPWFTVNQRGQSSYTTAWSYALDRWKNLALSEVNVVDDGVQLVRGNSSDVNSGTLVQIIEDNLVKLLDGRTITISALLSSGVLVTNTGVFAYKGGYDQLSKTSNGVTISVTSNSAGTENSFKVVCADVSSNVTIRAVKLEIGSLSTLSMDTIPNYATELAKCQEYFQVRVGDLSRAMTVLANRMQFNAPLPVRLRKSPTITATPRIFNLDTTEVTGFTFSYSAIDNLQTLRINADKTAHGLSDGYINAGTEKMYISAEL